MRDGKHIPPEQFKIRFELTKDKQQKIADHLNAATLKRSIRTHPEEDAMSQQDA